MSISLENVAENYLATKKLSIGTCQDYRSAVTKRTAWRNGVEVDQIGRADPRDFLDWVYEKAAGDGGYRSSEFLESAMKSSNLVAA